MFWKKKKAEEEVTLIDAPEASAQAKEQAELMAAGALKAIAKNINTAIKKGQFEVIWDCGVPNATIEQTSLQESLTARATFITKLRKQGYLVTWNANLYQLRVKW